MIRPGITKAFLWFFLLFLLSNSAGYSQTATLSASYRVIHTSTSRYFVSSKYIHTRNNETVVVGKWGDTEDGSDLLIMRLNERGEVLWSKKAVVGIELREYEVTEMSDGSLVLVANSWYNGPPTNSDMLLIKFTCMGDIVWSKNLSMNAAVSKRFMEPYSIKEGRDNDAIISFYGGGLGEMYTVISRVNSSGSLVWSKTFYGTHAETNLPAVSFFADNKIVVFGFKSLYSNYYNYNKSFFAMKLNYDNGAVEETKGYNYSEFITNSTVLVTHPKIHFYVEQLTDGNFALYGQFSNMDRQKAYFYKLIIHKDLSVGRAKAFSTPFELGMGWSKMYVFPNEQTHILSSVNEREKLYWYAIDGLNNKIRERKIDYPGAYLHLQYSAGQSGPKRSTYIVSSITRAKSSIEVVQAEDNDPGIITCLGTDTSSIEEMSWQVSNGNAEWKAVKDNEATIGALQLTTSPVSVTSEYMCEPVKGQGPQNNQIKISGEDTICFPAAEQSYIAFIKNRGTPVQWELDSDQNGSLSRLNDSTVSVSFKDPGAMPLRLKLYAYAGGCNVLKDSILITVFPGNNKLSGNFTTCDLPLKISPGPWFKNYLWQDGSKDSVYLVTKPGKYSVKLQTYCGASLTDSVEIAASGTGLKKNYSICENDSVTIIAANGFARYEWGPVYNITPLSANSIRVHPNKDTSYTLKITTAAGCELMDTVFVKVHKPASINLGKDTALCQYQTLTLDAGNNFSSYNWSSGAATQKLVVDKPGTYSVKLVDKNSCVATDTITVGARECLNSIFIPTAFTPNGDGKNDQFKPLVSGRMVEYELVVYNRLGEVVFRTSEVNNGWSGTHKGRSQKTEAYVWMCRYQFENEKPKFEKGTLLLIL